MVSGCMPVTLRLNRLARPARAVLDFLVNDILSPSWS
jgi:hypothetical protein